MDDAKSGCGEGQRGAEDAIELHFQPQPHQHGGPPADADLAILGPIQGMSVSELPVWLNLTLRRTTTTQNKPTTIPTGPTTMLPMRSPNTPRSRREPMSTVRHSTQCAPRHIN